MLYYKSSRSDFEKTILLTEARQ